MMRGKQEFDEGMEVKLYTKLEIIVPCRMVREWGCVCDPIFGERNKNTAGCMAIGIASPSCRNINITA
jgi:hypothetical protein